MTKTLQTKRVQGGMDHNGEGTGYTPPYTLYRFVDTDNEREVRNATWRSSVEAAERAWSIFHPETVA